MTLLATHDVPNIIKYLFVKLCYAVHSSRPATPEVSVSWPKHTYLFDKHAEI